MKTIRSYKSKVFKEPKSDIGAFSVWDAGDSKVVVHIGKLNVAMQWFNADNFVSPKPINIFEAKNWSSNTLAVKKGDYIYIQMSRAAGFLTLKARQEKHEAIPNEQKKPTDTVWFPLAYIEKVVTPKSGEKFLVINQLFNSDIFAKKEYVNSFEPILWKETTPSDSEKSDSTGSKGGGWKAVFTPGALHMSHDEVDPYDPLITFAGEVPMKSYPVCDVAAGDQFYLNFKVDGPDDSKLIGVPYFEKREEEIEDAREKRPGYDADQPVEDPEGVVGSYSVFIGQILDDGGELYWEPAWRSDYIYHRDRRFGDIEDSTLTPPDEGSSSTPTTTTIPPPSVPPNSNLYSIYHILCNPRGTGTPASTDYPYPPPESGSTPGEGAPDTVIVTGLGKVNHLDYNSEDDEYTSEDERYVLYWNGTNWVIFDRETGSGWDNGTDPDNPYGPYEPRDGNTNPLTLRITTSESPFQSEYDQDYETPNAGPGEIDTYIWGTNNTYGETYDNEPKPEWATPIGFDGGIYQTVTNCPSEGLMWQDNTKYGGGATTNYFDYHTQQIILNMPSEGAGASTSTS